MTTMKPPATECLEKAVKFIDDASLYPEFEILNSNFPPFVSAEDISDFIQFGKTTRKYWKSVFVKEYECAARSNCSSLTSDYPPMLEEVSEAERNELCNQKKKLETEIKNSETEFIEACKILHDVLQEYDKMSFDVQQLFEERKQVEVAADMPQIEELSKERQGLVQFRKDLQDDECRLKKELAEFESSELNDAKMRSGEWSHLCRMVNKNNSFSKLLFEDASDLLQCYLDTNIAIDSCGSQNDSAANEINDEERFHSDYFHQENDLSVTRNGEGGNANCTSVSRTSLRNSDDVNKKKLNLHTFLNNPEEELDQFLSYHRSLFQKFYLQYNAAKDMSPILCMTPAFDHQLLNRDESVLKEMIRQSCNDIRSMDDLEHNHLVPSNKETCENQMTQSAKRYSFETVGKERNDELSPTSYLPFSSSVYPVLGIYIPSVNFGSVSDLEWKYKSIGIVILPDISDTDSSIFPKSKNQTKIDEEMRLFWNLTKEVPFSVFTIISPSDLSSEVTSYQIQNDILDLCQNFKLTFGQNNETNEPPRLNITTSDLSNVLMEFKERLHQLVLANGCDMRLVNSPIYQDVESSIENNFVNDVCGVQTSSNSHSRFFIDFVSLMNVRHLEVSGERN